MFKRLIIQLLLCQIVFISLSTAFSSSKSSLSSSSSTISTIAKPSAPSKSSLSLLETARLQYKNNNNNKTVFFDSKKNNQSFASFKLKPPPLPSSLTFDEEEEEDNDIIPMSSVEDTIPNRTKRQLSACYSNPCNSGTCYDLHLSQLTLGGFFCVCPYGYTGTQCEKEINECSSNPCRNDAQCLDLIGSFFCSCPSGYSGVLCETQTGIKVCPENACGDGECVLTTHPTFQYACKCKDGSHKFEPCSSTSAKSKCAGNPCGTNLCIDAPNSPSGYVCNCGANDFRPFNCQTLLAEAMCSSSTCKNGGTCIPYNVANSWCSPSQAGLTCCQCVTGYSGLACEMEINECSSNPCQNGGVCDNLVNSYKCNCQLGFGGTNCEQKEGCRVNNCRFGGTCVLSSDGRETCACKVGFTGPLCEIDINECESSPCQNGGTCIDLENSYACYCPDGYFRPTFCPAITTTPTTTRSTTTTTTVSPLAIQNIVSLCQQNICFNGGTCYIISQRDFICVCQPGYTGDMCQSCKNQFFITFFFFLSIQFITAIIFFPIQN